MKYVLRGTTLRHAAEEMLLHLLPTEPAILTEEMPEDGSDCTVIEVQEQAERVQVTVRTRMGGQTRTCTREEKLTSEEPLLRKRRITEVLKLGIYDTVTPGLEEAPVWGALTGVRPAKFVRKMLESGVSRGECAERMRSRFHVAPERAALAIRSAAYAQQVLESLPEDQVSLYVGIPFCPSRCYYCSFVSAAVEKSRPLIAPYVDALCEEVRDTGALLRELGKRVTSIYIGGGTPTTLSAEQLRLLMETLKREVDFSALREYTVEAGRPDTITEEKLWVIRQGGASRISINPQTMNDAVLRQIGRRHSAEDVRVAYEAARKIGFDVINMDTIAGLTGDTAESFSETIRALIALAPENITVHTLAIKRAAELADKAENAAKHALVGHMLADAEKQLSTAGYGPYYLYRQKFSAGGFENVGWCRQGTESIYNIVMMEELQTILSLGAGGVSKRVTPETGKITRFTNPKYPLEYLEHPARIREGKRKLLSNGK